MDYYSKATWLVIVLFVCFNFKCNEASNSNLSREEELELEEQLKLLNKPFIKTFQTKEGDIIDCVDINKQPALDHPLLKNHKVQTRPSRYLSKFFKDDSAHSNNDILTSNNNNREGCPVGFVPIRRTLKEDLIRLRSLSSINKKQISSTSQSSNKPQDDQSDDFILDTVMFPYNRNVVSHSLMKGEKYYGVNARISVYNVSLSFEQSSSANIWMVGGPDDSLSVLLVGWQVNPPVNGDSLSRMFVYWTADGGATTGCYNILCQGFVHVNSNTYLGSALLPASIYQGQQYDYQFSIIQFEGNWWVLVGDNQVGLGYWPKELLPNLSNGADQIAWGGIARPSPDGMSPPLGNGHKPNANGEYNAACYIRNIQYIASDHTNASPNWDNTISYVSNSSCYELNPNQNCGHDQFKYCFTFGGPGGYNCEATII